MRELKKKLKKQFYIVFSPEGLSPPQVVHTTHKSAMFAAVQMARFHPEGTFFVMGSMSAPVKPREETDVQEPAL